MGFEILARQGRSNVYTGDLTDLQGLPMQLLDTETMGFQAGVEGSPVLVDVSEAATAGGSGVHVDQLGDASTTPPTPAQYTVTLNPDVVDTLPEGPLDAEVLVVSGGLTRTASRGVLHVLAPLGG